MQKAGCTKSCLVYKINIHFLQAVTQLLLFLFSNETDIILNSHRLVILRMLIDNYMQ